MKSRNIYLNKSQYFDGIVEKVNVENDLKIITLVIEQWNPDETHTLSKLKFSDVAFQSLPEIFSFNLINEIIFERENELGLALFDDYLNENSVLEFPNTRENIENEILKLSSPKWFILKSPYSSDWIVICGEMTLSEEIKNNALRES